MIHYMELYGALGEALSSAPEIRNKDKSEAKFSQKLPDTAATQAGFADISNLNLHAGYLEAPYRSQNAGIK